MQPPPSYQMPHRTYIILGRSPLRLRLPNPATPYQFRFLALIQPESMRI